MKFKEKDNLFTQTGSTEKFEFNEPVARVFDDMLERSVPMYRECLQSAVDWARRFARQGTHVYDLGCSTGTLMAHLADGGSLQDMIKQRGRLSYRLLKREFDLDDEQLEDVKEDLINIDLWIRKDNPAAADRVRQAVEGVFVSLCDFPEKAHHYKPPSGVDLHVGTLGAAPLRPAAK